MTVFVLAAGVVLVLLLLRGVVTRDLAWTASRSPGSLPLPVPQRFADTTALFAAVDAYVAAERRAVRAPGLSLVIVHDSGLVHRRAFGVADPTGRPVTTDTPFILGSLTKSFTALAIMQLADAGRLTLDAPVQLYLPWFTVRDHAAAATITVRHLLNHTSGIPKSAGLQLIRGAEAATRVQEARLMSGVRLHHVPGAAFEYSNANYWLLGLVVESASGVSYEEYVRTHIFAPLRLAHTFTDEREAQAHGLAKGYRVWFGFPHAEELPYYWREMSVGYLISSGDDMGHYLLAHLNGGADGGAPVISRRGLAALHTPPAGSPYAMGWLTDTVAGTPILWHTGALANYHGDMLLVPSSRWGVVILCNTNNFILERQLSGAVRGVAALLLGYAPPAPPPFRFRAKYALILIAALAWVASRVRQVATLRAWRRQRPARAAGSSPWPPVRILLDPGISLGLLVGVPLLLATPLSTLRWFVPDLTDWLIVNTVVAVAIAVVRLTLSTAPRPLAGMHRSSSAEDSSLRPADVGASAG